MSDKKNLIDTALAKWLLAAVAVLSLGWGVFQTFHTKSPQIKYDIVSQARVFNKSESLSTVRMIVDTVDVLSDNRNVSYFVIKIQNSGNEHLRCADYDEGEFGLRINGGTVLQEVRFDKASSQYIEDKNKGRLLSYSEHFIEIPKIALDKDEWYLITFPVIHKDDEQPTFVPIGKVIGQKQIIVSEQSSDTEYLMFGKRLLFGGFWVNFIRAFLFLLIWIVILGLVVFVTSSISDFLDERKREIVLKQITQDSKIPGFIRDEYLAFQDYYVKIASHYYAMGNNAINKIYTKAVEYINPVKITKNDFDRYKTICRDINSLVEKGYLLKDPSGVITIPRDVKEAVDKIQNILQSNHMDPSSLRGYISSFSRDVEIIDGIDEDD